MKFEFFFYCNLNSVSLLDISINGAIINIYIVYFSYIANEEYYQMMMINETYPCNLDILSYTVEEVDTITTEYIMKNGVSSLTSF